MSAEGTYRPKRRIRHEVYSLLAVLAVPLAVAFVFPYQALSWKAQPDVSQSRAPCAFVHLSADERENAIAAARSAIRTTPDQMRSLRADLSMAAVPDEDLSAVSDVSARARLDYDRPERFQTPVFPSSFAAPPPVRLGRDAKPDAASSAFTRNDMLKFEGLD